MQITLSVAPVSTHSHPKVAADFVFNSWLWFSCFNTQPPEGGCFRQPDINLWQVVSTHSHPKVAAASDLFRVDYHSVSTHSHPKVAARERFNPIFAGIKFQHTATRRWLPQNIAFINVVLPVSTHSHPKVAAQASGWLRQTLTVSTHSHPKVAATKLS